MTLDLHLCKVVIYEFGGWRMDCVIFAFGSDQLMSRVESSAGSSDPGLHVGHLWYLLRSCTLRTKHQSSGPPTVLAIGYDSKMVGEYADSQG